MDTSSFLFSLNGQIIDKKKFSFDKAKFTIIANQIKFNRFDTLVIIYKYLPVDLPLKIDIIDKFIIVDQYDTTKDYTKIERKFNILNPKEYFGERITTSGYLYRGFSFATNQDFQLNSGLRLEMNGYLSDDIYLSAVLNDENTPILPEGNTERLQEFDKIYINAKHRNWNITLGDFDFNKNYGTFFNINRKLQGFTGNYFNNNHSIDLSYANQKGKFYSYSFQPSNQFNGPYTILGENGQKDILIIAGSEKVYLDGKELKRGENNDYVIDYSNAQITFTPKVILTNYSRITIDFEYTAFKYQRNFFSTNYDYKSDKQNFLFNISFTKETDKYNNPTNFTLTNDDKNIIKFAGNDIRKAIKSGVVKVDTNQRGYYKKIDTMIGSKSYTYYRYAPGDTNSIYIVNFSFVGDNKGDYIKKTTLEYVFVGEGKGNYMPIIYLPVPESKIILSSGLTFIIDNRFSVVSNVAFSSIDKNTLSKTNKSNDGVAAEIVANLDNLYISDDIYLKIDTKNRFISKEFNAFSRYNNVNFYDNYSIANFILAPSNEILSEINSGIFYNDKIKIIGGYGFFSRGEIISKRQNIEYYHNIFDLMEISFNGNFSRSKNNIQKSSLNDIFIDISSNKKNAFTTGISYKNINRKTTNNLGKYILPFENYQKYSWYNYYTTTSYKIQYTYDYMEDYGIIDNIKQKQSYHQLHNFSANYFSNYLTSNNLVIYRKISYTDIFRSKGYSDFNSLTAKNNTYFRLFNFITNEIYYEVTTQKMQTYQKVFIKVKKGTGNYSYLGDLNKNGIADEQEFTINTFDGDYILEVIPIADITPVTDLKSSYRVKLDFKNYEKLKSFHFLSTETYIRVEENSKDPKKENIYLLKISKFQNDNYTVMGNRIFWQDIYLFENSDDINFKYRYTEKNGLNNFVLGKEKIKYFENSYKLFTKLVEEISSENEIKFYRDNFDAPKTLNRSRKINATNFITIFSYRPIKEILFDITSEFENMKDNYPSKPYKLTKNLQKVGFTYNFILNGNVRVEFERTEYSLSEKKAIVPIDLLGSYQIGKNFLVRVNSNVNLFDAGIFSLNYQGRKTENNFFIHYFSAEARIAL